MPYPENLSHPDFRVETVVNLELDLDHHDPAEDSTLPVPQTADPVRPIRCPK